MAFDIKDASGEYRVMDTAIPFAHALMEAGIPYAKEIWELLDVTGYDPNYDYFKEEKYKTANQRIVSQGFKETRHRLMNKILNRTKIRQVISLGSGFNPGMLEFIDNNKDAKCIERQIKSAISLMKLVARDMPND